MQCLYIFLLFFFIQSHNSYGLTELQFKNLWNDNSTRFSIFANLISLIKRMQDTEKITHNKNCAACNIQIIGIRFKCRTCHDLSLCFSCFTKGYVKGKHEARHRLTEVFKEVIFILLKISLYFVIYLFA